MTEQLKEIRTILMGRTIPGESGRLTAVRKGEFHFSTGLGDGAAAVRILGVCRKSTVFDTELSPEEATKIAWVRMMDLGRCLELRCQAETAACFIRYILTRPAVLTFRYIDGVPTLTAWAGRGMTGWISVRRALAAFEKDLTPELTPTDEKAPSLPELAKKEKKRRRKADRQENDTKPDEDEPTGDEPAGDEPDGAESPEGDAAEGDAAE